MSVQFNIKTGDSHAVARLMRDEGLSRIVAATMAARGIVEPQEAHEFLNPSLDRDWKNPYDIPGMSDVADVVERAIKTDKHIIVFGDFDLDGISASTVLTRGLREFGARAHAFIPKRFEEGYGLTDEAVARLCTMYPDVGLIVTVDCGIACKEVSQHIVDAGILLAITDHHEPSDLVPEGVPVADPKLDPACESVVLAGVGVALKLVQALGGRLGQPYLWRMYTDFAALGTIADLMPMKGENRALVKAGLDSINDDPRPCIAALLKVCDGTGAQATSTNLSFSLNPRLNAAGRMGDAQLALDVLMSDDYEEACTLAMRLEAVNANRRKIESELSDLAREQAKEKYRGQRALIVAGSDWHEGVKGIVASRLVGIYGVPAFLFTVVGDEARGSGRSVGKVNLFKAVEGVSDILTRFGGHEAAVGVTLPARLLPEFERRLCEILGSLSESEFAPSLDIDACVDVEELVLQTAEELDRLAPFGRENPVPCYLATGVTLVNKRPVGSDGSHLACSITNGRSLVSSIMFHCSDINDIIRNESVVDVAFELQVNEWRDRRTVKAMLKNVIVPKPEDALVGNADPETVGFVSGLYDASDQFDAKLEPDTPIDADDPQRRHAREMWRRCANQSPAAFEAEVVRAIIGNAPLHKSQQEVLTLLGHERSVLSVMATGRGKSLIFHVHAMVRAFYHGQASLFVYPLRALISDQAFHLNERLSRFGVSCAVLTGETSPEDRVRFYRGIANGNIDLVLTTPEFLDCHIDEFVKTGRIGFVVVDEAHHVCEAKSGNRSAYGTLGDSIAKLGDPTVLALTATADDRVTADICRTLPIDRIVVDSSRRGNLSIDDKRNLKNRDEYLAHLVAQGEKTVVYVNSREHSVSLARMLRKRVPHRALTIGFYHAGLTRDERNRVEALFRTGALQVLVATSAFGEGVDIPDIRHVVLYHLPFNEVEFNQMSGRAGRDGDPACIHLLFGREDAGMNEHILEDMTPDRSVMAQMYRTLRAAQRSHADEFFMLKQEGFMISGTKQNQMISQACVTCGIAVFGELGLIETRQTFVSGRMERSVRVVENADKVNLTDSVRYREGLQDQEVFQAFRDWILGCDRASLYKRVSRPIKPTKGKIKIF